MVVTSAYGLEQLLALANTWHGPGAHRRLRRVTGGPMHDHLARPDDAAEFLRTHDVPVPDDAPGPDALAALRRIRKAVLASVDDGAPVQIPGELAGRARYRLDPDGTLRSAEPGWDRVIADLLPSFGELSAARDQLRRCGNGLCRFIFVDASRNRSRRWCEMATCGNRSKVGRFRHRHSTGRAPRQESASGASTSR